MSQVKYFPIVDYSQHPAFIPFSPVTHQDIDDLIKEHFANIDAIVNSEDIVSQVKEEEVDRVFKQDVANELNNIFLLCSNKITGKPELLTLLREALEETGNGLKKDVLFLRAGTNYKPGTFRSARSEQAITDIKKEGIYSCRLPDKVIQGMNNLSEGYQKELFVRRTGRMDCTVVLDLAGEFEKVLLSALEEAGAIGGVSEYLGRPVEPMYCALQLSHQDDNWWPNCYSDMGIGTAKTVYMHLDQAVMIPKTVIYLSQVKEENGPFRLIKGSHLWKRSTAQIMFFKMLDSKWGKVVSKGDLLNPSSNYYRTWMQSSKGREYFSGLPSSLRGTSHFGDDIVDGSELSKRLLADEKAFLSEEANCVTFIGGSAIHRGSQVEHGHRINLQIAWVPRTPLFKRSLRIAKRAVHQILKTQPIFKIK